MISIGFTGTRWGTTREQLDEIRRVSSEFITAHGFRSADPYGVSHGDCLGADSEFHRMVRCCFPGARIVKHPGPVTRWSAGCEADEAREPRTFMVRNANIVRESTVMIAAPIEDVEQKQGGTWGTIRIARNVMRPLAIVYPSGRVEKERWSW